MKVFINPGHAPQGSPDPGAVNENGLRESDVVACVGRLLEKYLTVAGVQVVKRLQSDSLEDIVNTANASDADIFVSLHCNAAGSPNASGAETYYWHTSAEGKKLAGCIQKQIVDNITVFDRGIKQCVPGTATNFYVVRGTDAVAVLVEMAFITNVEDATLLEYCQDNFARAVARGITDYQLMVE